MPRLLERTVAGSMIAQMRDIAKIIAATAAGFSMQACGPARRPVDKWRMNGGLQWVHSRFAAIIGGRTLGPVLAWAGPR